MANKSALLAAVVVIVFAAYVWPWYNFVQPTVLGIPFFYWWVLVWYAITTILLLVYTQAAGEETETREV
ncbi:MAG: DUF3311 domain-containing protein [Conexivisphaerales archaeon]